MDGRIGEALLVRHQFLFDEGEGERCVAPAVLEDAVDTIEEKEYAVHLGECQLDLARAKCLHSNGVRARELQQEHHAVFIRLKHTAIRFGADGQGKRFADGEIGRCTHAVSL